MKKFYQRFKREDKFHCLVPVYSGLGNMILKTPFFRALKKNYPNATIDVLMDLEYGTDSVLRGSNVINDTLILPKQSSFFNTLKFFKSIKGKYDVIVIGFDSTIVHLYFGATIAKIKTKIGHVQKPSSIKGFIRLLIQYFLLDTRVKVKEKRHEIDLYFDLIDLENRPEKLYRTIVSTTQDYSKEAKSLLVQNEILSRKYIILQVSAANGGKTPKIWPGIYFQSLIERFIDKGIKIVIVGDQNEREYSENIVKKFNHKVTNLTGSIPLSDVFLLIKDCQGIICHDSALMHVANSFDVPQIAIFGPGNLTKNFPKSKSSLVARIPMPCSPCIGLFYSGYKTEKQAFHLCPYDIACMKNLNPEMIWNLSRHHFNLN